MRRRYALIVAILATLVLCVRNTRSALGFLWALHHGAGPLALIALVPLGLALAVLWVAFRVASRSNHRRARLMFVGFAAALVLLNEAPLPGTEANRLRRQRAMDAIEVRSIRDEALLSPKGNPIGLRISYEVVSPRRIVVFAHTHVTPSRRELTPFVDEFWGLADTIDPESSSGIYKVLEGGRLYRLTASRLPYFLAYNEKTQQPCFRLPRSPAMPEADLVSAIKDRGRAKYDMTISLSSPTSDVGYHRTYVTSREYDLFAMYQTVVKDDYQPCSF